MELTDLLVARYPLFMLVALRAGGAFFTSPALGSRFLPPQWKAAFGLLFSLIVFPVVPAPPALPSDLLGWSAAALRELLVGLLLGTVSGLVLVAAEVAGQLLDIEVGFGMVNLIDPVSETPSPLIGTFYQILALSVFLGADAHHAVISAFAESYRFIPAGAGAMGGGLQPLVVRLFGGAFLSGVRLAVPVLGALFLVNVAVGLLAKTVPQMNLFVVGMPLKVGVGLALMAVALPLFVAAVERFFAAANGEVLQVIRQFSSE